jgi:hypothetical protein
MDKEVVQENQGVESKGKRKEKIKKGWKYTYPIWVNNSKENWEGQ